MSKIKKTNAIRILDRNKANYTVLQADDNDTERGGSALATKYGKDVNLVHKTLVAQGSSNAFYVFIIPLEHMLDLKKAAKATQEKKVEMIAEKNLLQLTGYVKGGCSPFGMKKQFPTFIHATPPKNDYVIVSGGRIGTQLEIATNDLVRITGGQVGDFTV
jgi:Cys-tRNA(Pro)/Cys-tRNA(Cys) deacylase